MGYLFFSCIAFRGSLICSDFSIWFLIFAGANFSLPPCTGPRSVFCKNLSPRPPWISSCPDYTCQPQSLLTCLDFSFLFISALWGFSLLSSSLSQTCKKIKTILFYIFLCSKLKSFLWIFDLTYWLKWKSLFYFKAMKEM